MININKFSTREERDQISKEINDTNKEFENLQDKLKVIELVNAFEELSAGYMFFEEGEWKKEQIKDYIYDEEHAYQIRNITKNFLEKINDTDDIEQLRYQATMFSEKLKDLNKKTNIFE